MSLSIGIVGLPNVGKSTLFNALTRSKQANVANYPFCTIDPNVGVVEVPDDRITRLGAVSQSKKIVPTTIEFLDIAGLVKGASLGEGLGNKFLSHIRGVDAIAQVVRAFTDNNITHVHERVNPEEDADIINTELALADLDTVKKRIENLKKGLKSSAAKELEQQISLLERVFAHVSGGFAARTLAFTEEESFWMKEVQLLTMKPMMYVVNIDENKDEKTRKIDEHTPQVEVSAKIEAELAELPLEEAKVYMKELGVEQSGLDKIILAGYALLDLITYATSGEPETRAWTVKRGTKAPQAAGVIHTDFVKGFIKADVTNWQDFVAYGGWSGAREKGKLRLEGKEYIIRDGDVCYFHVST